MESRSLGCRVLSVGNIQAGGAGKTPLVAHLARQSIQRGYITVVLTRGYLGNRERVGGLLPQVHAHSEKSPSQALTTQEWGDEPLLLRSLVPGLWIGVGANRSRVFEQEVLPPLMRHYGLSREELLRKMLVILDDGFQHRAIQRDIDIVALTSASRFERLFREFPSALRRAHLLIWTKGEADPLPKFGLPSARTRFVVAEPSGQNAGRSWWFLSGLGDPDSALSTLQDAGWKISKTIFFRDHARYSLPLVESILRDAQEAGCGLLVTGKDWVKLEELGLKIGPFLQRVEPEIEWVDGHAHVMALVWGSPETIASLHP